MDQQQVERKRQIGNDVVVVVFLDKATNFDPNSLISHFIHVVIAISKVETDDQSLVYKMAIACKEGVRPFGPAMPFPAIFPADDIFREFLLTKLINGERAALNAPVFLQKIMRTRAALYTAIILNSSSPRSPIATFRTSWGFDAVNKRRSMTIREGTLPTQVRHSIQIDRDATNPDIGTKKVARASRTMLVLPAFLRPSFDVQRNPEQFKGKKF